MPSGKRGQEVELNTAIRAITAAEDDVRLGRALQLRNGTIRRTLLGGPRYETKVPAPLAGGDLRLQARVRDTLGHESSTPGNTLVVFPELLTTVSARVVGQSLQPVAGGDLEVVTDLGASFAGISLVDGTSTVTDLPTKEGEITVTVTALLEFYNSPPRKPVMVHWWCSGRQHLTAAHHHWQYMSGVKSLILEWLGVAWNCGLLDRPGLENQRRFTPSVGSSPTPSAKSLFDLLWLRPLVSAEGQPEL